MNPSNEDEEQRNSALSLKFTAHCLSSKPGAFDQMLPRNWAAVFELAPGFADVSASSIGPGMHPQFLR